MPGRRVSRIRRNRSDINTAYTKDMHSLSEKALMLGSQAGKKMLALLVYFGNPKIWRS